MVEITLPIVLQLLQTAGILVGIIYYIMTIRVNQRNQALTLRSQDETLETRQTALMMQIFQELGSPEFWERYTTFRYGEGFNSFDEFMEKSGPVANPEGYAELSTFWYFYVALGSLVYRQKLDLDYVALFLGDLPTRAWEKWKPIIMRLREDYGWDGAWIAWEYLAHRMKEHLETHFNEQVVEDMRRQINAIPL